MKTIFTSALIVTILLSACTQKSSAPQEPSADEGKAAESDQQIKIVKYDGTVRTVTANFEEISDYYTELSPQIDKFYNEETPCISVESFTYYVGSSSTQKINEAKFKNWLENNMSQNDIDKFMTKTIDTLQNQNSNIFSNICITGNEIYITFWDQKYFFVALWEGEEFTIKQTLGVGKSDYNALFVPNYFGEKHLLGTGRGESRWYFAEFDFSTGSIDAIEVCGAVNEWNEDGDFTNVINVQCDMEYSSEKGVINYTELQLAKCSNEADQERKDDCFSSLANYDFAKTVKAEIGPQKICNLISDGKQKNVCYWGYAMNLKDAILCDQIKMNQETKLAPINTENCKEELNYENQGANWKLGSGVPYITDDRLYKGYGKFRGWIVIEKRDKNNFDTILFHVIEEDSSKLPPSLQKLGDAEITNLSSNFAITSLDHLPEYLRKSSANNPATIEVQGIAIYDDQLDFWLDYEIGNGSK